MLLVLNIKPPRLAPSDTNSASHCASHATVNFSPTLAVRPALPRASTGVKEEAQEGTTPTWTLRLDL